MEMKKTMETTIAHAAAAQNYGKVERTTTRE